MCVFQVDLPAISERDAADLKFARQMDMDMVFASFIRKPADIDAVNAALGPGDKIMVIAKIENQVCAVVLLKSSKAVE